MLTPLAHQFTKLNALAQLMRFIRADELERLAATHGYRQTNKRLLESAGGKFFHAQEFTRLK